MNIQQIEQILADTAYVRMAGTPEEVRCAEYLKGKCTELGYEAYMEPFEVKQYQVHRARLTVDGREIPCRGYWGDLSGSAEAELYYLANKDAYSLGQCRGKIVLVDGPMRYWMYQDLAANGAVGFITYDGNLNYTVQEIDQKEIRFEVTDETRMPGVHIGIADAIELVRSGAGKARIDLEETVSPGTSLNLLLDMPGEVDERILLSAHYDTTALSTGAYDNMSSCIGLLYLAEYLPTGPIAMACAFCGAAQRRGDCLALRLIASSTHSCELRYSSGHERAAVDSGHGFYRGLHRAYGWCRTVPCVSGDSG